MITKDEYLQFDGLDIKTINILVSEGIKTRDQLIEKLSANRNQFLNIPYFGRKRLFEICEWSGISDDIPPSQKAISDAKTFLIRHGYEVIDPNHDGMTKTVLMFDCGIKDHLHKTEKAAARCAHQQESQKRAAAHKTTNSRLIQSLLLREHGKTFHEIGESLDPSVSASRAREIVMKAIRMRDIGRLTMPAHD